MKNFFLLFFVLPVWILNAQPLNGNYTVGGSSPDFLTPQDAANALKWRGVSGPVFVNIRPGIYMRDGGLSSVMILDSIITGISPTNRITFQPDEAAGGNVENVILQIDQTTQTSTALVSIQTDYTTIRNLTFQDVDTTEAGANYLLSVSEYFSYNPTNEGIVVEGCRFIGNSSPPAGSTFGTDFGIYGSISVSDIVVRRNSFQRLMRSVHIGFSSDIPAGSVIVEDNEVLSATGSGVLFGHVIAVNAHNVIIRRNYLNNAGGMGSYWGIIVKADTGLVERNYILNGGSAHNNSYTAIRVGGLYSGNARSMMVVNNMISGSISIAQWFPQGERVGIEVNTRAAVIIHNTIVHPATEFQNSKGIKLVGDSSTVLNNIVIDYGSPSWSGESIVLFDQSGGVTGLISDYNVFYYSQPGNFIVKRGAVLYSSLGTYQAATGLDSHSIFKNIDFVNDTLYPHLSDCQAQDPELIGIPYPGILDDIDGDARSLTAPTRGADEGRMRSTRMFGDVFRISVPGTPFSVAAGKFDNLMADGLAVADYTNRQVLLYHNLPSTRSFVHSRTLSTGFKPVAVRFFDLDHDGYLDLVAGGDSTAIKVFWGDGVGGFPQDTTITTRGTVKSIDTGMVSFYNLRTIVLSEVSATDESYLCYLMNNNGRHLDHITVTAPSGLDTINAALYDIAVGDLDGNGSHEVAALGIDSWGTVTPFIVFVDTSLGNHPWGHHNLVHGFNTASYVGHNSNIVLGKFTGGSLNDIIATGGDDDECILLRNQGNLNFSAEPISANSAVGLATLDYDNDGDLDFATVNWELENDGVSVFLNDGTGHFTQEFNCFQKFGSGRPYSVVASDFDLDGKTDLAIVSQSLGGHDSLFVLYNFGNVTGIRNETLLLTPTAFSLSQNYPNPFNPTTTICYELPQAAHVTLKVYNVLGQKVATLVDDVQAPGKKSTSLDGTNLPSGIYFYRIQAGSFNQVKKMLLVK